MIQRYDTDTYGVHRLKDGDFVYYDDHLNALAESRVITDAQVEAAARVIYEHRWGRLALNPTLHIHESYHIAARAALEAARAAGGAK